MKTKPPLLLILMIIAMFLAVIANLLQIAQTILSWNWLITYNYTPSPLYSIFQAAFFAILFLVSGITLWLRTSWAPLLSGITIAVAFLWSWAGRLWLNQNPSPPGSLVFLAILSLAVLAIAEFSLYLLAPYMKMTRDQTDQGGQSE